LWRLCWRYIGFGVFVVRFSVNVGVGVVGVEVVPGVSVAVGIVVLIVCYGDCVGVTLSGERIKNISSLSCVQ